MGDFSFGEMMVVVIIAILIYGKDLPQAARKLASIYSKLKRQLTDVREEISRQIPHEDFKIDLPTEPGIDPPSAPVTLAATPSGGQVALTWTPSARATSYTVRRAAGEGEPWYVIASYITENSFTDGDVAAGTTLRYTVSAANTAGESGESDVTTAVIPATDAPTLEAVDSKPAEPTVPPPPANGEAVQAVYPSEPPVSEEKTAPGSTPA